MCKIGVLVLKRSQSSRHFQSRQVNPITLPLRSLGAHESGRRTRRENFLSVVTTVACRTLLESIDGRLKYSDLSPHPGDDALEDQASVRGVLRGFGSG